MAFKIVGAARVALCFLLIVLVVCPMGSDRVFAAISQVERSEDELLIFETYVNDALRSYGMLAYLPEGANESEALLPLNALARALSISMKVEPSEGLAKGWIFEEDNIIQLDLSRSVLLRNGKETPLPEGVAEAHYDDIYVRASALQDWLGIKFRPDISTLKLFISSERKLPFEQEAERKKRAESLAQPSSATRPDYAADKLLPYQWWSNPTIIWQQSVQANSSDGDNDVNGSFSLQARNDFGKFGSRFLISGTGGADQEAKINNATLTLDRRDPSNSMLGKMNAGKVAIGDVDYPDVPLITGRKRGRGISISSDSDFNISRSYGAEKFDVRGDAPIGWDAELYRNGYFIDFQEIDQDGRYSFDETELVRGYNLMRVVLYGPEGQKRIETHRIIRGQDMLPEGDVNYELALGQPEADFLPLAEDARTSSAFGGSAYIAYGVKNYLTIGASAYSGDDITNLNDERESSASVTAVAALGTVKVIGRVMRANEGRSGYSVDATTRVLNANITAAHTVYDGFHEDDKDLKQSSSVDINRNFGAFSASVRAEKASYQRKDNELTLDADLSTRIKGVQLTNTLERTMSDNSAQEEFNGELAVLTHLYDWRLRGNLNYDLERGATEDLRNAGLSAYRKLDGDATIRMTGAYDFLSNRFSADARYTREFDKYAIDFTLGGTNEDSYFGGLTFRTGLQPDHKGHYKMVSARDGGMGSLGLRAYVDENNNGAYDEGERLLQGISFRSNRGVIEGKTAEDGSLFINGLPESPTIFKLNKKSLPSIYIKPITESMEIIPRAGATAVIDMAFEQLGEIDGFVTFSGTDQNPASGVEIVLYNAKTGDEVQVGYSEYDGYYIFSAIPMGRYRVEAMPLWDSKGENASVDVAISVESPVASDRNLVVSKPAQAQPEEVSEDIVIEESHAGEVFIHLGSESSMSEAKNAQSKLWGRFPEQLGRISPEIRTVTVGSKTYYRVLGAVASREDGEALCRFIAPHNPVGGCAVLEL